MYCTPRSSSRCTRTHTHVSISTWEHSCQFVWWPLYMIGCAYTVQSIHNVHKSLIQSVPAQIQRPSLFHCLPVLVGCRGKTLMCQTAHMLGTSTQLILKHFLPLSPALCWMWRRCMSFNLSPSCREVGMVIACHAVQPPPPFLPSQASYCAALHRQRGNTRIAIPLINWLSTAHQFTLCGLITFFNGNPN